MFSSSRKQEIDRLKCSHHTLGLVFARTASPQGKKCRYRFVSALPPLFGVVIEVERLTLIPAVLVDLLLPKSGPAVPFFRGLLPRSGPLSFSSVSLASNGERRQVKVVLQIELVPEDVSDCGSDIVFVLHKCIQRSVSIMSYLKGFQRARLTLKSKALRSIVARLAHRFSNR